MDVRSFLARHAPFDALDPDALERVARSVEIEHFAPGTVILTQEGEPSRHLFVIRRGAVEVMDTGRLVDLLGEGEVFGGTSLVSGEAPTATVSAHEDTLCYLIPADVATEVLETSAGMTFLVRALRRRIVRIDESWEGERGGEQYRAVGSLIRRTPVVAEPSTTVADAAALMAREHVSSLLVPTPEGMGILTDRDLRTRVVAERRGPDTPVSEVMTPDAVTVPSTTLAGDVLLRMLENGFHHFPVTDEEGRLLGVVSDSDVMSIERHTPFALKATVERADDRGAVSKAGRGIPEVVGALMDASADPIDVGRVVGLIVDAMTRRFLELGIAELGDPPAPWSWLALGSAARHEQAIGTDQDHAMAYRLDGEPADEVDAYFAALAEIVTSGLEDAGIPRCRADAMATNAALRRPIPAWVQRLQEWMRDIGPVGSEQLSIVLDFRGVAGPLDAQEALDAVVRTAPTYAGFARQLARRALDLRPPTGFFRDLVVEARGEHAGTLDIKHGGTTIVSNLARAYAIGAGLTAKRTIHRLVEAERVGVIDEETRVALSEAFRFLWHIRLQHHVVLHRQGLPPEDHLDPAVLGPLARQGLKEAFRAISRAQRTLALETGTPVR
ncbi:MAG TPA: putative nucleotidyltransferase substrate binding domain-containing protein [Actinomycetota bacterium]|nr:putative nucleotidyltransferase substrate binding domain-containing protein [Actinomycetota bacterium]